MAVQAVSKSGFEKWQDGINSAVDDSRWNGWDCEIQMAVNEFSRHLSTTPGFRPLDWQLFKAMVWVETGANSPEWKVKPLQIGVPGDPGMSSLLSGDEGGDLILPPEWKRRLTTGSVRSMPAHNIRAGIGYLLMRMANFEYGVVFDADTSIHEVTVKGGDSFDRIAREKGTTIDTLKKLNPGVSTLRSGQVLKYQKAAVRRIIGGWRAITTGAIAQRYNGGGDPNYAKKLDYALSLVLKGKAAVCVP